MGKHQIIKDAHQFNQNMATFVWLSVQNPFIPP